MTSFESSSIRLFYFIKLFSKENENKIIPIRENKFTIGRKHDVVDYVIEDAAISRSHALVAKDSNNQWTVQNLSQNYLLLNEVPIKRMQVKSLRIGDAIKIGVPDNYYEFKFCMKKVDYKNDLKRKRNDNQETINDLKAKCEMQQKNEAEKIALEHRLREEEASRQIIVEEKNQLLQRMEEEKELMQQKLLAEKRAIEEEMNKERDLLNSRLVAVEKQNAKLEEEVLSKEEHMKTSEDLKMIEDVKQKQTLENMQNEREKMQSRLQELETNLEEKVILTSNLTVELKLKEETDRRLSALIEEKENLELRLQEASKAGEQVVDLQNALDFLEATKMSLEQEATKKLVDNVTNVLEDELQCPICNELLITAIMLNCSHVFCKFCIDCWKKTKKECPNCRARITTEARAYMLDSFIENIAATLSEDMLKRRKETMAAREVELEAARKVEQDAAASTSNRGGNRRGRGARGAG